MNNFNEDTIECHCMHTAHRYRQRKFINRLNQEVVRVFYRCENCWSRVNHDFIADIDKVQSVEVTELIKILSKH